MLDTAEAHGEEVLKLAGNEDKKSPPAEAGGLENSANFKTERLPTPAPMPQSVQALPLPPGSTA